jgi:hypothetical protein
VTLFPPSSQKARPVSDRRLPRRIATGAPRLVESSAERLARRNAESWAAIVDAIRRSAEGRLELLRSRDGKDRIGCPWARLITCDGSCRCGGVGTVTVDFLRDHYTRIAAEVEQIAKPAARPVRRSS